MYLALDERRRPQSTREMASLYPPPYPPTIVTGEPAAPTAPVPFGVTVDDIIWSGTVRKRFTPAGHSQRVGVWPKRWLEVHPTRLVWSEAVAPGGRPRSQGAMQLQLSATVMSNIANGKQLTYTTADGSALRIECATRAERDGLASAIRQAVGDLSVDLLPTAPPQSGPEAQSGPEPLPAWAVDGSGDSLNEAFPDVEWAVIVEALQACGGDAERAAERLLEMIRTRELGPLKGAPLA